MEKLIFWGAGNTTNFWWDDLQAVGMSPCYIVDSSKRGNCHGIQIMSPDELYQIQDIDQYKLIILSAAYRTQKAIKKQILQMNLKLKEICSCSEAYYEARKEDCESVLGLLNDDLSKKTLKAWVKSRIDGCDFPQELVDYHGYFSIPAFRGVSENEVFVDCGAYVGDTLEKYLFERFGVFKEYYAFEPFRSNYEALRHRVERLEKEWNVAGKIICENKALGAAAKVAVISNEISNIGAIIKEADSSASEIDVVSLDEYYAGGYYRIGCIKADIEGSEMDMLKGAEKVIRTQKPKLAISLYHKPGDVIDIIRLVHDYYSEYILDVRCGYLDGSDLILFAY